MSGGGLELRALFRWHKFLDPSYSDAHKRALESEPDNHSDEGYTNLGGEDRIAGKLWICRRCVEDFASELESVIVETDPDAWPYEGPEPDPRPTGADFRQTEGGWLPRPE